jgi:catechol 2,3-dioxygenase-like lactoylglutathione lyase family enzyme
MFGRVVAPCLRDTAPMQVRLARHTNDLRRLVAFYRDGLGLLEVGGFEDHAGYSGAFLKLPGTGCHLEFTTGGDHGPPDAHPQSLLVLYLGTSEAVRATAQRSHAPQVASANPYWDAIGAVTILDPDGFRVVLAPAAWP